MTSVTPGPARPGGALPIDDQGQPAAREAVPDPRRRRRLTAAVKDSLRETNLQLSLLSHQVGASLRLRDVDFDCLELITRHGPLKPTELARRAGLHAATVTGVLDRLERAGWVAREPDPADRRGVVVRALRERGREVFQRFAGMNGAMDRLCESYTEADLEVIADFLRRTAEAGRAATHEIAPR
jgi:DNA-binding MarR family transcriptional regulator